MDATSMVRAETKSRLSNLVATVRCWRSWLNARSTVLRSLAGGGVEGGRAAAFAAAPQPVAHLV